MSRRKDHPPVTVGSAHTQVGHECPRPRTSPSARRRPDLARRPARWRFLQGQARATAGRSPAGGGCWRGAERRARLLRSPRSSWPVIRWGICNEPERTANTTVGERAGASVRAEDAAAAFKAGGYGRCSLRPDAAIGGIVNPVCGLRDVQRLLREAETSVPSSSDQCGTDVGSADGSRPAGRRRTRRTTAPRPHAQDDTRRTRSLLVGLVRPLSQSDVAGLCSRVDVGPGRRVSPPVLVCPERLSG
jgi:hypothetical protein